MSINGWLDKENMLCMHSGVLLGLYKEGSPVTCDNMVVPKGHHVGWNKTDTEKQRLHDLVYMWYLLRSIS
jgi:hypothetical protein